jgi:hypothetical protein
MTPRLKLGGSTRHAHGDDEDVGRRAAAAAAKRAVHDDTDHDDAI